MTTKENIINDIREGKAMVVDTEWYNQRKEEWLIQLKTILGLRMIDTDDKEAIINYMRNQLNK